MRVLVLGCGEMGEVAVEDLYYHGEFDEIIIGTRSIEKAKKLMLKLTGKNCKVSVREIDVNNTEELQRTVRVIQRS